jgi:hypothetical protein
VPDVPVAPEPLEPVEAPAGPASGGGAVKQPAASAADAKAKENTKCFKGEFRQ